VSYGILLVIIVFQQDIRRGLVRIGRNLVGAPRVEGEMAICEHVIAAAAELARSKTRATLVIERPKLDAIAIAVDDAGGISLRAQGRVLEGLDEASLRKALHALLTPAPSRGKGGVGEVTEAV